MEPAAATTAGAVDGRDTRDVPHARGCHPDRRRDHRRHRDRRHRSGCRCRRLLLQPQQEALESSQMVLAALKALAAFCPWAPISYGCTLLPGGAVPLAWRRAAHACAPATVDRGRLFQQFDLIDIFCSLLRCPKTAIVVGRLCADHRGRRPRMWSHGRAAKELVCECLLQIVERRLQPAERTLVPTLFARLDDFVFAIQAFNGRGIDHDSYGILKRICQILSVLGTEQLCAMLADERDVPATMGAFLDIMIGLSSHDSLVLVSLEVPMWLRFLEHKVIMQARAL